MTLFKMHPAAVQLQADNAKELLKPYNALLAENEALKDEIRRLERRFKYGTLDAPGNESILNAVAAGVAREICGGGDAD